MNRILSMSRFTATEWIVLLLTVVVAAVLIIPIAGSTIGAVFYGKPVTHPETAEKITEIVVYLLGIVSGYVLREPKKPDQ